MAELNNHVILGHIDKPTRILFWPVGQFMCCSLPIFAGMILDCLMIGLIMSIFTMILFKIFNKTFGKRGISAILYWYLPTSNRLKKIGIPPSHIRIWGK